MTWNLRCEKEKKNIIYVLAIDYRNPHLVDKNLESNGKKNRLLEPASFNRPDNFLCLMDDFENISRIVSIYQLQMLESRVKFKLKFPLVDDNVLEVRISQNEMMKAIAVVSIRDGEKIQFF